MILLNYRSDIDGLRAVAVLGVVIYHAFPSAIPGGFIGVDIFFVISGYLISGILYKGHREGNFSFKEFYARRIRRLFPALITMLVITMGCGWLILLPDEFELLGKHIAAGTLFLQNFAFWQESGYFDTAASLKPLLHLWSLAVEEQFYIFFPLLLILLWKKQRLVAPSMVVLLVATFILNVVMSVQNGASDFFLTPYRAWEFLGGSLLACWHDDRGHEEEIPAYREALSWGGAILLLLGMAFIRTGDPYPGWRALLPVAGTLLLMEGGMGAWVNRKILSNGTVVWIGLISYPLYLFHWPALSFVHIVKGESPKPGYIIAALLVALLLTVTTYYLIEKKIRHNRSRLIIPTLVVLFALLGIGGICAWLKLLPAKPTSYKMKNIQIALDDKLEVKKMQDDMKHIKSNIPNLFIDTYGGGGKQTLFIGDSNMQQYYPRIVKLLIKNNPKSRGCIFLTAQGVLPIEGVKNKYQPITSSVPIINEIRKTISNDSRIDRVVIAARWLLYFRYKGGDGYEFNGKSVGDPSVQKDCFLELGKEIKDLVKKGKAVYIVLTIPTGEELDPIKIAHAKNTNILYKNEFIMKNQNILNPLKRIAIESGATVIDPMDYLCDEKGVCIAEDAKGVPIRYDEGHLRPGYVREQVKYLDFTVEP
jgi:peptidoglycan/LPS O-acetylase OafA/YrhL